jgi:outer membrane protein assembly factor BamD (BamD/ComL family)
MLAVKAPEPDPLAVEARLLQDARACLARGDASCASSKLAEHAARFSGGPLADEADLLAIDAARARADHASARSTAERLLARDPAGPYATRARAVLAEEPSSP